MFVDQLHVFLISISPFGEARLGIPYGVFKVVPVLLAFLIGWIANLLIFPLLFKTVDFSNSLFWNNKFYRKAAVYLSKRAKKKTKNNIEKYGFWGLMIFVMIPLPITGSYMGSLAAYIFRMEYKKSFLAISTGVSISCILIALGAYFGVKII